LALLSGLVDRSPSSLYSFLTPTALFEAIVWPWAQLTVVLIALFVLFCGWGLIRRQVWTQTLLVPAHLLFVVYALALWFAGSISHRHVYEGWAGKSLALLAAIAVNSLFAVWMNSVGTSEALSWLPLRTTNLVPLKCEFCGTPLDLSDGHCPQCQAAFQPKQDLPSKPPDAILVGIADGNEFFITSDHPVRIGRGSTHNEINLTNPTVSRRHAQIAFDKGYYVIETLDDRNGTFINNARVRRQTLHHGDEIRFGRAGYQFRIVE